MKQLVSTALSSSLEGRPCSMRGTLPRCKASKWSRLPASVASAAGTSMIMLMGSLEPMRLRSRSTLWMFSEAVPPPFRRSFDERILDRLMPAPEPPLNIVPSSTYQLRIDDISSSTTWV